MTTQAHLGQQAMDRRDYQEAVTQYTAALKTSQSPLWLINRSTAYQRLGKHELAIVDADNAVVVAVQRSRREQIATAQFRRAVAFHALKQFGNARMCLIWCRKYNEKEKALGIWQAKVASDYEAAEKEDKKELLEVTAKEVPDPVKEVGSVEKDEETGKKPVATATTTSAPALSRTPKEKIRHEWLQSNSKVTITIFAKGVPKDKAEIDIQESSVSLPVTPTKLFAKIP
jgi:suppressor of G2 allele of SKP1